MPDFPPHELVSLRDTIVSIANEAAALLLSHWRRPGGPRVEYKGAIDLVTESDRASEDFIRTRFAHELRGVEVVAEELGGTASGTRPVAFIDPLDGTTNFAHGHPFFAVSIGVMDVSGAMLCGVVSAPALGVVYAGARGHGCTRNGERCTVSGTTVLDRSLLATGFPYDRRTNSDNNFREFVELKRVTHGVRRCGAASLDLALVADGTYDGFWEKRLKPWDLAAGTLLVLEAGGRVTSTDGSPLDVRAGHVLASNGHVHDELTAALAHAGTLPGV